MQLINKEGEASEKLWQEADSIYEPFDWGEDISTFPEEDDLVNNDSENVI